jgi:hypothetical protein
MWTDVSEKYVASFLCVDKLAKQETSMELCLLPAAKSITEDGTFQHYYPFIQEERSRWLSSHRVKVTVAKRSSISFLCFNYINYFHIIYKSLILCYDQWMSHTCMSAFIKQFTVNFDSQHQEPHDNQACRPFNNSLIKLSVVLGIS